MTEWRRALVFTVACGLLSIPPALEAQLPTGKAPRIGYLGFSGASPSDEGFRQGLRELGYVEGQNVAIEYRYADLKPDRASALAAELVRLNVDVIVTTAGPIPALAAKRATTTIPIVFEAGDVVENGLVSRLDRPGGNLTGIDNFTAALNVKRLELLKEALPGVSRVAVLANRANPWTERRLKELEGAARVLRVKLHVLDTRKPNDIEVAFAAMAAKRDEAFLLVTDPMFWPQRERIIDLAATHRLPGIFFWRQYAEAGGLMSYAPNLAEARRRLAGYVDKILKGASPGDLPVEQPTRFEMVINLKTARALGITVPPSFLLRVDQVIE